MSYQVLARKWRPKTFREVVGQTHILTALSNGLKENRLHHAYLFSGTRGVGKTSIARLFAKGLNCIHGVTAEPCGECEHCKAIEQGNFIDLIEIDAASRTKVEDTRELLDNVQYKPVQGRYKVYLIDEVHMLSRHSFNALLKTLEEPPEYVKFLLATTDPQKLPITILSRCMQFHLKALDQQQISQHLAHILDAEKIPYELTALDRLAKSAQGSIRDSLSLTDQAIAMSNGDIRTDIVNKMLGLLDDNQPIEILYALQQGNGEKLMAVVQSVAEKGVDWDQLLLEVGEKLHQIAMQQLLPVNVQENSPITFLAQHMSPEDVQLFYQMIVMGRKELAFAPNRRIGAEMTLLRALAFHPKFSQAAAVQTVPTSNATENLVDMPVVSQNIKANYPAQHAVQHSPKEPSQKSIHAEGNQALSAVDQLQKLRATLNQQTDNEKKKSPLSKASNTRPDSVQPLELPVISSRPSKKTQPDLMDRLAKLADVAPSETVKPEVSSELDMASENPTEHDDNPTELNAEDYRWEWMNPELANQAESMRPSDIKKLILEQKSPELRQKMVKIGIERDPWFHIIEQLGLDDIKMAKQLAINSVLLAQNEQEVHLGLRSNQSHLQRENSIAALTQRLSDFFHHPLQLRITLHDDPATLTPLEHYQQIHQELIAQTTQNLLADNGIQLLQKHFEAKLDMDTIRPV
ncbi:DNA polymerase III subunit gamma/tau [Lonepinella sp. BR2271]|uniref:DNA polymerase III subunit gamma/tau n=1 Tax=Lonepinella sp. BR2271 TaxID=3434550 RepID=UPI003F6DD0CC